VNVKKIQSLAKVIGTAVTVGGAMVMTLYKGPIVDFMRSGGTSHPHAGGDGPHQSTNQHWVTGTLMLLASCCGWSGFFILQVTFENLCKVILANLLCREKQSYSGLYSSNQM